MKIAILSDIHDNVWALAGALSGMQDAEAMICCGDLCSPFIVGQLSAGFPNRPIHIVFGNNDGDLFRITDNAKKSGHIQIHGAFGQLDEESTNLALGGKRIAVNHYNDIAQVIAASGQFDLVCYGHNHAFKVEMVGSTLAVNPGAIMGYDPINKRDVPSTFVIYDTDTGEVNSYQVTPHVGSMTDRGEVTAYP